jgi:hypothetical protein
MDGLDKREQGIEHQIAETKKANEEAKRMLVSYERRLAEATDEVRGMLDEARRAGYSATLLDTLDDMEAARGLYTSLGFEEIPPYYFSPIAGSHYLKAELD